jgi:hypothetical protein
MEHSDPFARAIAAHRRLFWLIGALLLVATISLGINVILIGGLQ